MGVKSIWGTNAIALAILIGANLAASFAGETLWLLIGVVALLAMLYFCFKQGMVTGHGACGIRNTVESARNAGEKVFSQLDRRYLAQAWSRENAFKSCLLSALIPYAVGGLYIIFTLLWHDGALPEAPVIVARVLAWLLSLPYWPLIMHWHEDFVTLTPAIAGMLLISPFVLPAATALGYLQGPRLWARSEEAMKQGRRRAKARARVGKKLAPKQQKPEI